MNRKIFLTCMGLLVLMLASTELPIWLLSFSPWWRLWDIVAFVLAARGYQILDREKPLGEQLMMILVILGTFLSFSMLLLPLTLLITLGIYLYSTYVEVPRLSGETARRKQARQKLKALGASPRSRFICFHDMNGVGTIICRDCGHTIKNVTAFTHNDYDCDIGRQCPNCGEFFAEYNESDEYHTFGESEKDCICPKCHTVVRKKDESIFKGSDDPLFCPRCRSVRLRFLCEYMT